MYGKSLPILLFQECKKEAIYITGQWSPSYEAQCISSCNHWWNEFTAKMYHILFTETNPSNNLLSSLMIC